VEQFIFARFHARAGQKNAVEQALCGVADPSRREPSCVGFHVFRSTRELRPYYIHSRWWDEAVFDTHAGVAHTVRFLKPDGTANRRAKRGNARRNHPLDTRPYEAVAPGTSPTIIGTLNKAVHTALAEPEVHGGFLKQSFHPAPMPPAGDRCVPPRRVREMGKVVREANIKVN
jgi:quinol monooxygenase YgiN